MTQNILIIPPAMAYPGSRGDEALIFGIKDYLSGRKKVNLSVLAEDKTNPEWKPFVEEGITVHNLKNISKHIKNYQKLFVLGADVIDGGSQVHNALEFFDLMCQFKIPTTIIGFSFNKNPISSVIKKFKELPDDTKFFLRDPFSLRRFINETGKDAKQVADVGFLLTPKKPDDPIIKWIKEQKYHGRLVIGVNINNNKLSKKIFQAYIDALRDIKNVSLVIIPHDSRSFCGDVEAVELIWNELPKNLRKYSLKLDILRAREIKYLCKELDCMITGRMHLSIACFGQTTPVVCIGYQNKMKGLFSFFDLQKYTIERDEVNKLKELLEDLIKHRNKIKEKIKNKLPKVLELAKKNFE